MTTFLDELTRLNTMNLLGGLVKASEAYKELGQHQQLNALYNQFQQANKGVVSETDKSVKDINQSLQSAYADIVDKNKKPDERLQAITRDVNASLQLFKSLNKVGNYQDLITNFVIPMSRLGDEGAKLANRLTNVVNQEIAVQEQKLKIPFMQMNAVNSVMQSYKLLQDINQSAKLFAKNSRNADLTYRVRQQQLNDELRKEGVQDLAAMMVSDEIYNDTLQQFGKTGTINLADFRDKLADKYSNNKYFSQAYAGIIGKLFDNAKVWISLGKLKGGLGQDNLTQTQTILETYQAMKNNTIRALDLLYSPDYQTARDEYVKRLKKVHGEETDTPDDVVLKKYGGWFADKQAIDAMLSGAYTKDVNNYYESMYDPSSEMYYGNYEKMLANLLHIGSDDIPYSKKVTIPMPNGNNVTLDLQDLMWGTDALVKNYEENGIVKQGGHVEYLGKMYVVKGNKSKMVNGTMQNIYYLHDPQTGKNITAGIGDVKYHSNFYIPSYTIENVNGKYVLEIE